MKYCITTTRNNCISLTYPLCLRPICDILLQEGYVGSSFFGAELGMNMDFVEHRLASFHRRSPNRSMDMAVGLCNEMGAQEVLFVEFRFNYINLQNLNRVVLEGKVLGTNDIFRGHYPVREEYIFIFQSNLKEQAKNRIQRMIPQVPSSFAVMDIAELHEKYFT